MKPQICITYPLLAGTDGDVKMSKSQGNYIGINEPPDVQYGKLMSLPDKVIIHYFSLVTRWVPEQIADLEQNLKQGLLHPMNAKKKLAGEIVHIFHGEEAAKAAAANFTRVHQTGGFPDEMVVFSINKPMNIINLLVETRLCTSKSEARRAVVQGGIKMDNQVVNRIDTIVKPQNCVITKGKRNFVRLSYDGC